jgi:hypothetical protein
MSNSIILSHWRELISALDRRLPQPLRPGEEAIARQAAALRSRAVARIAELEGEPGIR